MNKLTKGQELALETLSDFALSPMESTKNSMVLSGYSGTGKTTVTKALIDNIHQVAELRRILLNATGHKRTVPHYEIALTATTNKACEALANAAAQSATTIHSYLGIRVKSAYSKAGKPITTITDATKRPTCNILIIDEASFIDADLLSKIEEATKHIKVIYIGDPAQLAPIGSSSTPVFNCGFPTVYLTEVVRQQEDNQIIDVSKRFRDAVNGETYEPFDPDMDKVVYLEPIKFDKAIADEFSRPDFTEQDAKVLVFTNNKVKDYNATIKDQLTGSHELKAGDYATCNSYFKSGGSCPFYYVFSGYREKSLSIKTDSTVLVTDVKDFTSQAGLQMRGFNIKVNGKQGQAFTCLDHAQLERYRKLLVKGQSHVQLKILDSWLIDLRPLYSCTINKSQGSTYKKVFLDLNDVDKCRSLNQRQRMLYVGFSRASEKVYVTGDISRGL